MWCGSSMPRIRASSASAALAAALVAGCLVLAFHGERADLPALDAEGYPHVVPAARLLPELTARGKQIGRVEDGGVRLWANAAFGHRLDNPASGPVPLYLVARGSSVEGVYPYLTLRVDGELRDAVYVSSETWGLYRVSVELSRGEHDLEWSFVNDHSRYPESRDLDLHSLSFGTPPPEAERYHRWRAPCRLDPSRMAQRAFGRAEDDGYRLWNRGTLADDVYFPRAGRYDVRISAGPATAAADRSLLELLVDGRPVETLQVSGDGAVHTLSIEVDEGRHRLEWIHRAPPSDAPPEQDLLVRSITIGKPVLHTTRVMTPLRLSSDHVALSGDRVERRSNGVSLGGIWAMWQSGYLKQTVISEQQGTWRLTLRARGDLCDGRGPRVLVMTNADQLAVLEIDTVQFEDFALPLALAAGRHDLTLVYENDRFVDGSCDRNLYVEQVAFDRDEQGTMPAN